MDKVRYDFDTVHDRRNTASLKWNVLENELPMWVADMDFATAPEVVEEIKKRAEHGIFGYNEVPDEWYEAYINRWSSLHGLIMKKNELLFCTGVVAAISSIVRKLTTPNENVLIQTPVYNIFFNSVLNNGRRVLDNTLVYRDGCYSIDFDDLEKKLADPQTTLMILCNPHNPVGKIWDKDELARIGELCSKYHVTVISDEIHCEITTPGKGYVPFASVSETCRSISITCISPTKTFNIAGLQTAAIFIPDSFLRHKVWRAINTDEVAEPNTFACIAAIAAFNKGGAWAEEMNEYVSRNRERAEAYIKENIPEIKAVHGEATYLMWLDIGGVGKSRDVASYIRKKTGLYLTPGVEFGESGDDFLRLNIACPASLLDDGLSRLKAGIAAYVNRT